jgi:hypothetical protein
MSKPKNKTGVSLLKSDATQLRELKVRILPRPPLGSV